MELAMPRYANERKASLAARRCQKVKQSRRLNKGKDEPKVADQRMLAVLSSWCRSLDARDYGVSVPKGGQISCSVPAPESMPKPKERNIKFHNRYPTRI